MQDMKQSAAEPIIRIRGLSKRYADGFEALKAVDLDIQAGEILALLGPNGAGKTTLIGVVCGLVEPSEGEVSVDGHDIVGAYRRARAQIGLVPQELTTTPFESVLDAVSFSRGLFGLAPDPAHIEKVLRDLSLWDKRKSQIMALSGGMKRRVLIAKALAHEPRILFLDEPTAGVDVELRKGMWDVVRELRGQGVTVILTTHYIEEAEEIADRVAVIDKGRILLVDEKNALMSRLGRKTLTAHLARPIDALPPALARFDLTLSDDGLMITYSYGDPASGSQAAEGVEPLLRAMLEAGLSLSDIQTEQSSLEEIFVDLVRPGAPAAGEDQKATAKAEETVR